MSEMLPPNWISIELSKAVIYGKGKKPKVLSAEEKDGLVPYIDIKAFEKGIIDEYADVESSKLIDENDILVVWDGARFGLTGMGIAGAAGSTLMVLKPVICHPMYIHGFINRYYSYINSKPKGTGTPHVNPDIFWNLPFPVAPINEQQRIVAKLDAVMPRIEAVKRRLEKIPIILKRFRQSVLTAAVTGKLTEKWRENHPEVESLFPELLNDNLDIPGNWKAVPLQQLINELRNGVPTRPNLNPPGTKILRISANRSGSVNLDDYRFLPKGEEKYSQFLLKGGDLLFTRYNGNIDLVGVCGKVRKLEENYLYPDKLMRVRVNQKLCYADYLEIVFQTNDIRNYIISKSKTSAGQNGLSGKDLKGTPVPLPPLEEQKEIIKQVDNLFAFANKVEAHYQKAKSRVDKLSQSVLAKAFRGELVPQDPDDEPAEKLLERIREEKVRMEAALKETKKRFPN